MKGRKGEINSSKILYIIDCFNVMEENDKPMGENLIRLPQYVIGAG